MKYLTRFGLFLAGLFGCCPITHADPITFTFTNINVPGGAITSLNSINNAGQIVGTDGQHGFLYTNGVFTNIDVPGAIATIPSKINNLGQIAGTYRDSSNRLNLFLDTNDVFTTINVPGNLDFAESLESVPRVGLNDLGQIVGTTDLSPYGITAFLYSNGQFSFIPARGGILNASAAFDINNAGQIALQEATNGSTRFLSYVYFNGNYTQIDSFVSSFPTGINNAGHVVGHDYQIGSRTLSYFYADGEITTFVYDPSLPLPPFYFINGLNDADQLVGTGPGGGVLATPVPEPASLLLFAGGLTVVGLLLRRKNDASRCSTRSPQESNY